MERDRSCQLGDLGNIFVLCPVLGFHFAPFFHVYFRMSRSVVGLNRPLYPDQQYTSGSGSNSRPICFRHACTTSVREIFRPSRLPRSTNEWQDRVCSRNPAIIVFLVWRLRISQCVQCPWTLCYRTTGIPSSFSMRGAKRTVWSILLDKMQV